MYISPVLRDCSVLADQQIYPDKGSVLDLQPLIRTTPGFPRRIVQVGDKIFEEGRLDRPLVMCGNNTGASAYNSLQLEYQDRIVEKLLAQGCNYVRWHHLEAYLKYTTFNSQATILGDRTYVPERWAELHSLLYKFKMAGIGYSFGAASGNLALNTRGLDRYDSTLNTTGTITLTIVGGVITAAAIATANGTPYPTPPSVIIADAVDGNGWGAVIESDINAITGAVTGYRVISGGQGYASNATAVNYGGTGKAGFRARFDRRILQHLSDMICIDFLGAISPITGVAYKDEPACWQVECINESHMAILIQTYGSGGVPAQLLPQWVNFLAARYGTIANLNTAWGTSHLGWWSVALRARAPGAQPDGTKAQRCHYAESKKWIDDSDSEFYSWMVQQIRATGYKGLVISRDMAGEPCVTKTYAESGANMQGLHGYAGLVDSLAAGTLYNSGGTSFNAPVGHPYGSNPVFQCLAVVTGDIPWMFTEAGYPVPGRYRGEYGLVYGGYASTHGAVGVTLHADYLCTFVYGPNDPLNRYGSRGLRPHGYEHDPLTQSSTWFMKRMLHRGDIDALPIAKVLTLSNRALTNFSDYTQLGTPAFTYRMVGLAAEYLVTVPVTRYVQKWDATNDPTIASTWLTEIQKGLLTQVSEAGYTNADTFGNWIVGRGNQTLTGNTDRSSSAASYTKRQSGAGKQNSRVFFDRVAGLFGIDSLRSQALVASGNFAQGAATVVRRGNLFTANAGRTSSAAQGYAYDKNHDGEQFFLDMSIDYIEDGTFFGVTSYDAVPISLADRLILCASSNYYNTGYSGAANGQLLTGVTLNGGTGYPAVAEFGVGGNGGSATLLVYSTAGVPTSYMIVPGQRGGFTGAPTSYVQAAGGGSGLTFTNAVLADDSDARETKIAVGYTGTLDGWPIQQQAFNLAARIRNIDMSKPWILYELDFRGQRIASYPTKRTKKGLQVKINSQKLKQPSTFFELVKGTQFRKSKSRV